MSAWNANVSLSVRLDSLYDYISGPSTAVLVNDDLSSTSS